MKHVHTRSLFLIVCLSLLSTLASQGLAEPNDKPEAFKSAEPIIADKSDQENSESVPSEQEEKIQIVYSKDSTAMLRAMSIIKREMDNSVGKAPSEYKKFRNDLIEQEILLIELNDSDFNRHAILPYQESKFDWKDNISTILKPIFSSLNSITDKPRRTSELEEELIYMQAHTKAIARGIAVFEQIAENYDPQSQEYKSAYEVSEYWYSKLLEAKQKTIHVEEKLAAIELEKPFSEQLNASIAAAFTSKLITIIWAVFSAAIAYLGFNWLAHFFNDFETKAKDRRTKLFHRLWFFCIQLLSSLMALLSIFIVIYLRSDWVLLGLLIIALFFLAIGLKDSIPSYLTEMRTMLNLGSAKEGERIVYEGIPWKVEKLGMYSHLHNPDLDAHYHVALTKLADLNSRPYHSNEPFFPCRKGHWVKLSDGTFGQILMQSPENVVMKTLKSTQTIPTSDFLSLAPKNMSTQENVTTTVFGIDYQYQDIITSEAQQKLQDFLSRASRPEEYANAILEVKVDFMLANASSLDYLIICTVSGEAAQYTFAIQRWLQAQCVNAANEFGWTIPFQQVTIHKE